jgi:hypothetical protein
MNKPVLGMLAGGALGALDGLTALVSAPETAPHIGSIVIGSVGKGLIAGLIIGFVARKVNNLGIGVAVGLLVGAALALPIAMMRDPNTGQVYFWEILIPGSIVGLIVGFATQRYGTRPAR